VTVEIVHRPRGGRARVSLPNPGRFARVTAVVVNSDISQSGFDDSAGDYSWDNDGARYSVSLAR
jgi:hypothetical protein